MPPANASEWASMYGSIREHLFSHMRSDARRDVADVFEALTRVEFAPALIHGDFGTANLLFDPARERISGVIDFDGVCIGDPATDVAALMSYGEDFIGRFAREYGCSRAMLARADLYRGTFALQEALFGVEHDDPDAFTDGIADYT